MKCARDFFFVTCVFALAFFSCKSYSSDFVPDLLLSECGTDISISNDDPYIVVMPENAEAAMVFMPGGLVEYQSYLPLMVKCAKKGIACFIVRVPGDFSILNTSAASRVIKRYPQFTRWYIAGHSLGGAMAATYAEKHSDELEGLILLAAYSVDDLTKTGLRVLSVYGSNDGVLNREKYEACKVNLPEGSTELVIEGGNHGQFGNYGEQKGDGEATITSEEQQNKTADAIAALMSL